MAVRYSGVQRTETMTKDSEYASVFLFKDIFLTNGNIYKCTYLIGILEIVQNLRGLLKLLKTANVWHLNDNSIQMN